MTHILSGMQDAIWANRVYARPQAIMARANGQSFWAARFRDRVDLYEWDCPWEEIPKATKKTMVELRLCCPNGRVLPLGAEPAPGAGRRIDFGERFFQFKVAAVTTGAMRGVSSIVDLMSGRQSPMQLQGHVIGFIDGVNGECILHAWEPPWKVSYEEQYDDSRPQDFQAPANDGSGGVVWLPRKTIVERHPGVTREGMRCRIEALTGKEIRIVGYQDNVLTRLSQDVLGIRAD